MLPRSSGEPIGSTWTGGCEGSVVLGSTSVQAVVPCAPERRIRAERPGPSRRQRSAPDGRLDDVAVHAHPLGVGIGRQCGMVDAGGDLDAQGGHGLAQCEHLRQGRGPLLRVGDATSLGAAGGVGEDGVDTTLDQVDLQGVGALDARVGEGMRLDGGQGLLWPHRGRRRAPAGRARPGRRRRHRFHSPGPRPSPRPRPCNGRRGGLRPLAEWPAPGFRR